MHLCSGLDYIVDLLGFRDLFGLNLDTILGVAEFAIP
jgi:hypothetical protein